MFCERDEDIALLNKMRDVYPYADAYVLDLFVWCYIHKREEYDALMEKHKDYNYKTDMVAIMDDAVMRGLLEQDKPVEKEE